MMRIDNDRREALRIQDSATQVMPELGFAPRSCRYCWSSLLNQVTALTVLERERVSHFVWSGDETHCWEMDGLMTNGWAERQKRKMREGATRP